MRNWLSSRENSGRVVSLTAVGIIEAAALAREDGVFPAPGDAGKPALRRRFYQTLSLLEVMGTD